MAPRRVARASACSARSSIERVDARVPARLRPPRAPRRCARTARAPPSAGRATARGPPPRNVRLTGSPLAMAIRASAAATTAAKASFAAGRVLAAVAHRRRRVDQEAERAIGLGLELAHDQAVVTQQRAPIEPAQIVARHVLAVAAELDPRPALARCGACRRRRPRPPAAREAAAARAPPSRWRWRMGARARSRDRRRRAEADRRPATCRDRACRARARPR